MLQLDQWQIEQYRELREEATKMMQSQNSRRAESIDNKMKRKTDQARMKIEICDLSKNVK